MIVALTNMYFLNSFAECKKILSFPLLNLMGILNRLSEHGSQRKPIIGKQSIIVLLRTKHLQENEKGYSSLKQFSCIESNFHSFPNKNESLIDRNIHFIEWEMYIFFCLFRTALTEWCTRLIIFVILSVLNFQLQRQNL